MAAIRLRKAFQYPEDSGEDREELDEEEQEQVIRRLQRQNETRNAQYSMVFSAIPLISVVAFLPTIFYASSLTECLLSCLGILSLLATAYTMRHSPLQPDRKGKKPSSAEDQRLVLVRTALVPANGVVCLALTAAYFLAGANPSYTTRPMLFLIPGAILAVILIARETMLSVDLSALKDLQYEYKGA